MNTEKAVAFNSHSPSIHRMDSELLHNDTFEQALADYFYLIDKNYPEKGALKLVGDRYRLIREFRTILYRGVSSKANSMQRARRLVNIPENKLIIDGYNVLLTLLNYRLGHFVFICTDSICRDAGALFGKIPRERFFTDCLVMLIEYLCNFRKVHYEIYLDSPVTFSIEHKNQMEELMNYHKLQGNVNVVRSADTALEKYSDGILATSDSAIIDHCPNNIIDIPRYIIEKNYKSEIFNLNDKLNSILKKCE